MATTLPRSATRCTGSSRRRGRRAHRVRARGRRGPPLGHGTRCARPLGRGRPARRRHPLAGSRRRPLAGNRTSGPSPGTSARRSRRRARHGTAPDVVAHRGDAARRRRRRPARGAAARGRGRRPRGARRCPCSDHVGDRRVHGGLVGGPRERRDAAHLLGRRRRRPAHRVGPTPCSLARDGSLAGSPEPSNRRSRRGPSSGHARHDRRRVACGSLDEHLVRLDAGTGPDDAPRHRALDDRVGGDTDPPPDTCRFARR